MKDKTDDQIIEFWENIFCWNPETQANMRKEIASFLAKEKLSFWDCLREAEKLCDHGPNYWQADC